MSEEQEGDLAIAPVNMAQSMSIAAAMVHSLIAAAFVKPEDTDEEKVAATYICLAVFFHALCCNARHKDKMAGILKAVVAELEQPDSAAK